MSYYYDPVSGEIKSGGTGAQVQQTESLFGKTVNVGITPAQADLANNLAKAEVAAQQKSGYVVSPTAQSIVSNPVKATQTDNTLNNYQTALDAIQNYAAQKNIVLPVTTPLLNAVVTAISPQQQALAKQAQPQNQPVTQSTAQGNNASEVQQAGAVTTQQSVQQSGIAAAGVSASAIKIAAGKLLSNKLGLAVGIAVVGLTLLAVLRK